MLARVLVLNRRSLTQSYRLEPHRYDAESDQDEREEVIWESQRQRKDGTF